jgi:hypothetical protein
MDLKFYIFILDQMTTGKLLEAFDSGDLAEFEKLLNESPNKGQIIQCGPNPIPCLAAAKGLTDFLQGDISKIFAMQLLLKLTCTNSNSEHRSLELHSS